MISQVHTVNPYICFHVLSHDKDIDIAIGRYTLPHSPFHRGPTRGISIEVEVPVKKSWAAWPQEALLGRHGDGKCRWGRSAPA